MVDYNSPEYKRSLDSFLEGCDWLTNFELFGYDIELILYINHDNGDIDESRCESLVISKDKEFCLLHD